MKKLIALVLALALVMAVAVASAAKITINRDSSWEETTATGEKNDTTFTWYKIFDAAITTAGTVNEASGETTTAGVAVYTISGDNAATKVAALPNIFTSKLASDGKYYITLTDSSTTSTAIATALGTMLSNETTAALFYEGTLTTHASPVEITTASNGYYYIAASNGKDVVVQTIGTVTINEKNDYPTIDKKQKKASGSYAETALPQEIGSYIDYQVTVHVPADATKQIAVIDTMTTGLEYDADQGLSVKYGDADVAYATLTSTDAGYNANATWQIKFVPETVVAQRGHDIVIKYRAKVTAAALSDSGKENEVTLNYDNGNYILKDDTDYETYFAGIYKVDPNNTTADMSGVTFYLKDGNGTAVNVTYDSTNGYYVVDPTSNSNIVETRAETGTDSNGEQKTFYTIKIRGLDGDKTYTVTEKETVAGYNLLEGAKTLTKTKDEGTAFSGKVLDTFDKVENNKGTTLPSTGGIGTTIFYILGGLLVVGAAVILVARRRVHE